MTSRFRITTTLARNLEELGVRPADVLRQADLDRPLLTHTRTFSRCSHRSFRRRLSLDRPRLRPGSAPTRVMVVGVEVLYSGQDG